MADVSRIYDKACEAFDRKNYDYAVNLYQQVIALDPDHQKAHKGLYATCMKKKESAGATSKLGSLFGGIKNTSVLASLGALGKPDKIAVEAQRILVTDPTNSKVRAAYGRALKDMNHLEGAVVELEMALQFDSDNVDILKALAQCYDAKNDIAKAQELFARVLKRVPEDRDAHKALRDLAARGTIQDSKLETAGHSRDMVKDKDVLKDQEQAIKLVKSGDELDQEIAKIRELINADPTNLQMAKQWKKIGEIYKKKRDAHGALKAYEEALKLDTSDATIRFNIGDMKMRIIEEEKNAAQTAGNVELAKKLTQDLVAFKIAEYAQRVKDHPTDTGLKYDYGTALYQGRQFKEALGQFQQTVKDPKRKMNSLLYQGLSFHQLKSFDLAVNNFRKAIEENTVPGNDFDKNVRYHLATTLEAKGDKAGACAEYERIMEIDISYKDVSAKVEKLKGELGT
ncbi:MAG: tetratricopeptide repeat protein [Planctomycetes bacterium]|nr:tetratricopeptide repeat protein [Planctomycetota bacterium]